MKLYNSELNVLNVLWENGDVTAKKIASILNEKTGWSKTTSYTVIKKCLSKDLVSRQEPNFTCHALITKEQAQDEETALLIDKLFDGMSDRLIASILKKKNLTQEEINKIKGIIKKL